MVRLHLATHKRSLAVSTSLVLSKANKNEIEVKKNKAKKSMLFAFAKVDHPGEKRSYKVYNTRTVKGKNMQQFQKPCLPLYSN